MSVAAIRTQIKTILEGVSGIGVIHERERWSESWSKFLEYFQDPATGRISGCMITRKSTSAVRDSNATLSRDHKFKMRFVSGLQDANATEITFQDLLEAAQGAFDSNNTLNGTVRDSGPAQIDLVENRMFGTVLCHYGEISLDASERVFY